MTPPAIQRQVQKDSNLDADFLDSFGFPMILFSERDTISVYSDIDDLF